MGLSDGAQVLNGHHTAKKSYSRGEEGTTNSLSTVIILIYVHICILRMPVSDITAPLRLECHHYANSQHLYVALIAMW